MNKFFYTLLLIVFIFSCKNDEAIPSKEELQQQIADYIQNNSLSALQTASGVYYQRLFTISSGRTPQTGDLVELNIKGEFLDGSTIPNTTGTLRVPVGGKAFNGQNYLLEEFEDVLKESRLQDSIRVFLPVNPIQTYRYKVLSIRSELEQIEKVKTDSVLATTITGSGLEYVITNQGTGNAPTATSNVRVRYTLRDLRGQILDQSDISGANFNLGGQLIAGFKEAVLLLKEGGKGIFILPSALGYGNTQTADGRILPYTVLYFEIELIETL